MSASDAGRGVSVLYTPELLGLTVSLADWPIDPAHSRSGEARSPTCGSTVAFACTVSPTGRIENPGLRVTACAVGQAAAALFVTSSTGRSRHEIETARDAIGRWLAGEDGAPDWPGLAILDPARAYPARHGAILLPWNAALAALPKETAAG